MEPGEFRAAREKFLRAIPQISTTILPEITPAFAKLEIGDRNTPLR
jgi:hypothetical protein